MRRPCEHGFTAITHCGPCLRAYRRAQWHRRYKRKTRDAECEHNVFKLAHAKFASKCPDCQQQKWREDWAARKERMAQR